jgi:hypothetical protein
MRRGVAFVPEGQGEFRGAVHAPIIKNVEWL